MVTIIDIAKALGVTPSTVSRALAGSPRVNEDTRLAVQQMADKLGYRRNILAANLRRGKSDIVGIVIPRVNRQFFSNLISGAESVLEEAGYHALICQTNEDYREEALALRTLRNYRVAGVFLSHAINAPDSSHVLSALGDIPLVQFDRVFNDLPGAKVTADDFDGAYEATMHLIQNGYRRIGTLAGYVASSTYAARMNGYRKALEDSGMEVDESIIYQDSILRTTGHEAALRALDAGCDALYSAGDFSALGAMDALKERGVSVPCEFGLVGTANEFFTALTTPTISSLEQHPFEMGQEAARAFLSRSTGSLVLPMELHVRESSNKNNLCLK